MQQGTKTVHLKEFHPDQHQMKTFIVCFWVRLSSSFFYIFRHIQQKLKLRRPLICEDVPLSVMFGAQIWVKSC